MMRNVLASMLTVLVCTSIAVPISTSSASTVRSGAAKPRPGVYACTLYDAATGMLETKYNVKVAPKGKYQYARFTTRGRLVDPKNGTYSLSKKRIVFKTGPMKSRYGKLERTGTTPTISIYTKKPNKDTYVDCYKQ